MATFEWEGERAVQTCFFPKNPKLDQSIYRGLGWKWRRGCERGVARAGNLFLFRQSPIGSQAPPSLSQSVPNPKDQKILEPAPVWPLFIRVSICVEILVCAPIWGHTAPHNQ